MTPYPYHSFPTELTDIASHYRDGAREASLINASMAANTYLLQVTTLLILTTTPCSTGKKPLKAKV
jgi:hypothetical protein